MRFQGPGSLILWDTHPLQRPGPETPPSTNSALHLPSPPRPPAPCQPPQQDWNLRIHPNSGTWEETLEGSHQNPAHEGEEENGGKVWVASYLPTGDKPTATVCCGLEWGCADTDRHPPCAKVSPGSLLRHHWLHLRRNPETETLPRALCSHLPSSSFPNAPSWGGSFGRSQVRPIPPRFPGALWLPD